MKNGGEDCYMIRLCTGVLIPILIIFIGFCDTYVFEAYSVYCIMVDCHRVKSHPVPRKSLCMKENENRISLFIFSNGQ